MEGPGVVVDPVNGNLASVMAAETAAGNWGSGRYISAERVPSMTGSGYYNNKCFPVDSCMAEQGIFHDFTHVTIPIPQCSLAKKVAAEFIGTFMLIFAGTATAIVNEKFDGTITTIGLAASSGLAIMVIILATGHISGAHCNPSLTIAFAVLRHFPWIQVPFYVGSQLLASICAGFALKGIFHPDLHGGVTIPHGDEYWQSFVLEFIISFNLMFVVTAVATDTRAVGELAGIAVGGVVTLNILIAGATSGGSMNPVRTLGPAIAANNYKGIWLYIVGPIFGAITGAIAYTIVRTKPDGRTPTIRREAVNTNM